MNRKVIYNGGVSEVAKPKGLRPSEILKVVGTEPEKLAEIAGLADDPEYTSLLGELKDLQQQAKENSLLLKEPRYISLLSKLQEVIKRKRKDMVAG